MNYTLNQLKIFLKVAGNLSITRAAEDLHLTQPAVSIQLKKFQEQFDIPLMETIGKKIHLTEFGKEIAEAAQKIMQEVNEVKILANQHKGLLTGKLKLAVVSTGKYIAPYFLSDFINQNHGIDLVMDVTNRSQVLQALEANEVDFALLSVLPKNILIEKIPLLSNKLFMVGGSSTKTIKTQKIETGKLKNLPFIFRESGSATRQIMEKFFISAKLSVTKKIELTSNEAVKQAVIAGLGYSIMPLIGIKNELKNKELKIIPVKGFPIETTWTLVWLKGKKLSPVAKAYLEFLKNNKKDITNGRFGWAVDFH